MRVSVEFSRTIRPGDYQSKTARVFIESSELPEGVDEEATIADLFLKAQATVLTQLGIEFVIDPEGIVCEEDPVEAVVTGLPGTTVVQGMPPAAMPPTQVPNFPAPAQPMAPQPVQPISTSPCPKCGTNDWWDNRADNNRKRATGFQLGADFKCKNCKHALWPDDYQQFKHLPREPR